MLTIEDIAERLNCSDDQVRVLIRTGQLEHVNIGSGRQRKCIRVTEQQLDDFLKGRTSQRPEPRRRTSQPKPAREWV